ALASAPPMRCLRLRGILQSSAPPTPQGIDPVENAGGPSTPRACEPLAVAAKHCGCVGVGHEQASELAVVVAFDEPDAARAGNDAQRVKPTVVALMRSPTIGLSNPIRLRSDRDSLNA